MDKICLFGASGHGKVIKEIIESTGNEVIAFVDDHPVSNQLLGVSVFETRALKDFTTRKFIISIGNNATRKKISEKFDIKYTKAVHDKAMVSNSVLVNEGTVIMAGAIVNSDSLIEEFCILNTKSSLGHDSKMKKFSSLAPNATTGGHVNIGEFSAVSIGATIIQSIKIGKHSVIGAGALVLDDIGNNLIAFGSPAKDIKERQIGESYLAK
mgnify:CR=1 FL=1